MIRTVALLALLAAPAAEAAPVRLVAEGVVAEAGPSFDPALIGEAGRLVLAYDDAARDAAEEPALGTFFLDPVGLVFEVAGTRLADPLSFGLAELATGDRSSGARLRAVVLTDDREDIFGILSVTFSGPVGIDPDRLSAASGLADGADVGGFALEIDGTGERLAFELTSVRIAPIPLPASGALLAGVLALGYSRARRTRAGRAASGRQANSNPAASVASTPPATMATALPQATA